MPLETFPYDTAEHLKTLDDIAAYLEAVLEEDDPSLLRHALDAAVRAHGMMPIAQETGRSRELLDRILSEAGNPQLDTLMGVLKAIGLRLSVKPIETEA